jgi:hypothetical protein
LRVDLYFVAVIIASYAISHAELRPDTARRELVVGQAGRHTALMIDIEDAERSSFAQQFSITVAHYQDVCTAETERTLSIVALSAWILVVPRAVILWFGLFLVIIRLIILLVQRNEHNKINKSPPASTPSSVEKHTPVPAAQARNVDLEQQYVGDDNANDDGEGSLDASLDAEESGDNSLESMEPPSPASSRAASADDMKRRSSATASATIVPTPPSPMLSTPTSGTRVKTKIITMNK